MVKVSRRQVWWVGITDNKPSQYYFEDFKTAMLDDDIKVNQKTFDTIEIVVDKKDITYVWVSDSKYDYYYYYNRIVRVLPNGFVLEFKLDLYTTYTLPFINDLYTKNKKIKALRHHKLKLESTTYQDEMIDSIPVMIKESKIEASKDEIFDFNPQINWRVYENKYDDRYYYYFTPTSGQYDNTLNPIKYYVFTNKTNRNSLVFIPVLTDRITNNNSLYAIVPHLEGRSFKIYNSEENIRLLTGVLNSKDYEIVKDVSVGNVVVPPSLTTQNQFLGIYILPPIYNFKPENWDALNLEVNLSTGKETLRFLSIAIEDKGVEFQNGYTGGINNAYELIRTDALPIDYSLSRPTLNKTDKLHILVSHRIDFKFYGTSLKPSFLYQAGSARLKLGYNQCWFNFTNQAFFCYSTKFQQVGNTSFSYPSQLPVFVDKYMNYVAANQNTRDTSLSIAKQQMTMGILGNVFGGALGIGGSLANGLTTSGSGIGAAQGLVGNVVNTGMGIAQNVLGYQNTVNTMKAQYADAKNTIGAEIQSGSVVDASLGVLASRINYLSISNSYDYRGLGDIFQWNELTEDSIASLNNVIYWYGNFCPEINTWDYFMNVRNTSLPFNYIQLDSEYLRNVFNQFAYEARGLPTQAEYFGYIFNTLTQGVRIWNVQPNI